MKSSPHHTGDWGRQELPPIFQRAIDRAMDAITWPIICGAAAYLVAQVIRGMR